MIIELPRNFSSSTKERHAIVRSDGILEIKGHCDFGKLMADIAYKMKGRKVCRYCHRKIDPQKMTIDHLYPQEFGGISITNNLGPACANCNRDKASLNEAEYIVMRALSSKRDKEIYYKERINAKNKRKYNCLINPGFDLPAEWIELRNAKNFNKVGPSKFYRKCRNYKRARSFIQKHKKLPKPVVISKNGIILEGESIYHAARDEHITWIPVVVLENVIVLL